MTFTAPTPYISVIIPVYNGGDTFERCLAAARASTFPDFEIVVVDDGSRDGSGARAEAAGARVFRNERPLGAAAARNRGAREARGVILFFMDADVEILTDTMDRIAAFFRTGEGDAVIGSYTPHTPAPGYFSQFKNIHHHYIHQISHATATTFWTGCGAVRRDAFVAARGFDHTRYAGATVEDIDFGYRLTQAGFSIRLDRDLQVIHHKTYNLWTLMRSDIFYRAVPWTVLMLRGSHFRSDLNTTPNNAVSVFLSAIIVAGLLAAPFKPWTLAGVAAATLLFALNTMPFNRYVKRYFGWGFTLATVAMSVWYFFYSGVGLVLGLAAAVVAPFPKKTAAPPAGPR
jgi:glycosyltransferase involved in cell wall biosynthesis